MSNLSKTFAAYLRGYIGSNALAMLETEREITSAALGVHHRVTSRPPLMSSVAVTAELRAMAPKQRVEPVTFTRLLLTNIASNQKIPAIKTVREISNMGLLEAKRICDDVCAGTTLELAPLVGTWLRPELTPSDRLVAAAKLLRDAGCTVEVA